MGEKDTQDIKIKMATMEGDIKEIKSLIQNLDKTLNQKMDLMNENTEEKIKVVNHRVADMESNQKWIITGLLGSFGTFLMTLLTSFVKK